ncbi:MAG: hypothetical protein JOY69_06435, partial [Candidatus Eremiobacteraeota bacterium]|nr:hypothetical protein [Candidatus Eremiobacteraeota bacterium]
IVPITGGTIGFPGQVQWSANTKSMNVGDQDTFSAPTVYQVSSSGAITGSTVLTCENSSGCDYTGTFIKGSSLVAASGNQILEYPYPAGGNPTKVLTPSQLSGAGSVVISPNVP